MDITKVNLIHNGEHTIPERLRPFLEAINVQGQVLHENFVSKLEINSDLSRRLVSFQANKLTNGHRWCSYKEGFSSELVRYIQKGVGPTSGKILDPFAGSGTALFTASNLGLDSVGIELLPNSIDIMEVRRLILLSDTKKLAKLLVQFKDDRIWEKPGLSVSITHLRITEGAYPPKTESQLRRYIYEAIKVNHEVLRRTLLFAAMCVLESISYTRKDGQYLRWDIRSGRHVGKKPFQKNTILSFSEAICAKLMDIAEDIKSKDFKTPHGSKRRGKISVLPGSCLTLLPSLDSQSFDGIITSPPYCNRYDYTRTYALELAYLGVTEEQIRELRQAMLCCTVENRAKGSINSLFERQVIDNFQFAFANQALLQSILQYLDECKEIRFLNNLGIPRMVRNYFFELALVIADCGRVLRPGAPMIMVNDNVQYAGVTIPVDLILSDIAQKVGFNIEKIWILPSGKGNSSQQMGLYGRNESRKCVYVWRRSLK